MDEGFLECSWLFALLSTLFRAVFFHTFIFYYFVFHYCYLLIHMGVIITFVLFLMEQLQKIHNIIGNTFEKQENRKNQSTSKTDPNDSLNNLGTGLWTGPSFLYYCGFCDWISSSILPNNLYLFLLPSLPCAEKS